MPVVIQYLTESSISPPRCNLCLYCVQYRVKNVHLSNNYNLLNSLKLSKLPLPLSHSLGAEPALTLGFLEAEARGCNLEPWGLRLHVYPTAAVISCKKQVPELLWWGPVQLNSTRNSLKQTDHHRLSAFTVETAAASTELCGQFLQQLPGTFQHWLIPSSSANYGALSVLGLL
ncbi:hypothetical protein L209DRAFT_129018 [Thermothelomyces heterothallicus CBS 203.75]